MYKGAEGEKGGAQEEVNQEQAMYAEKLFQIWGSVPKLKSNLF